MRGLHFAIVDEADSVLIDEARTPLIISGETEPGDERRWAEEALHLARRSTPSAAFAFWRTSAGSETVSRRLADAGLDHVVLSAAQDRGEAEIIARAGERGRITVATNMAGRGVDIKLADGVAELGGLRVILTERHEVGRIDRQLAGRCGRQGEPGSTEAILSLEDRLLDVSGDPPAMAARRLARVPGPLGRVAGALLFRRAQRRAERTHSRVRRELVRLDRRLGTLLAFAGGME